MTFAIVFYTLCHDAFYVVEEDVGLRLGIQIIGDFPVAASLGLEFGFASRVGKGAAVEYESASVAAEVVGITFLEREAVELLKALGKW